MSEAQNIMNERKLDPLVWDDVNKFTNVVLDIWGSADEININLLLADEDLTRSGEARYQQFTYDYVNNGVEINYALCSVFLDMATGSENTSPVQNDILVKTETNATRSNTILK